VVRPGRYLPRIDIRLATRVDQPPTALRPIVADLATYPEWLAIVRAVERDADGWVVGLGARIGPITQTKRVRMVRTAHDVDRVRFERAELDGRPHPAWVLDVRLAETGRGTEVTVHLHYAGAPTIPFLEGVLAGEARRAGARLGELAAERAD